MLKQFFFILFSICAVAQPVTVGVKGGTLLGDPTTAGPGFHVSPNHWTAGPVLEFHFPLRLSLETGFLYSSYSVTYPAVGTLTQWRSEHKSWDVPAVIKYRFSSGVFRPFVFAGANYRRQEGEFRLPSSGASYSASGDRVGPTAGAGIEWKPGRIRIAPEFRYIHVNRPGADQYGILLGITF